MYNKKLTTRIKANIIAKNRGASAKCGCSFFTTKVCRHSKIIVINDKSVGIRNTNNKEMREVTIDLDKILLSQKPVGYEIAKKISSAEIEYYQSILGITPQSIKKITREKRTERKELFEAVVRIYPTISKRESGMSEYLKKNIVTCFSIWRNITEGDMKKEYMLLERLNEYIKDTDPKYLKKLSNWLKEVVLEPEESKTFSQSDIKIL